MCRYDGVLHYIILQTLHYNTLHYNRFVLLPTLIFLTCSRDLSSFVEHFLPLIPKKYQYAQKSISDVWNGQYLTLEGKISIFYYAGRYTHTFPHFAGRYTHTFPHFAGKYEYTSPQSKYLLYLTGKVNKFRSLINNSIYYLKYQVLG